jgi:hypothetical protein
MGKKRNQNLADINEYKIYPWLNTNTISWNKIRYITKHGEQMLSSKCIFTYDELDGLIFSEIILEILTIAKRGANIVKIFEKLESRVNFKVTSSMSSEILYHIYHCMKHGLIV